MPFHIIGDEVPEEPESFRIFLSIAEGTTGLRIGRNFSSLINIVDNDGKYNYFDIYHSSFRAGNMHLMQFFDRR